MLVKHESGRYYQYRMKVSSLCFFQSTPYDQSVAKINEHLLSIYNGLSSVLHALCAPSSLHSYSDHESRCYNVFPGYRWRSWGLKRLSSLPKFKCLRSSEIGIWIRHLCSQWLWELAEVGAVQLCSPLPPDFTFMELSTVQSHSDPVSSLAGSTSVQSKIYWWS